MPQRPETLRQIAIDQWASVLQRDADLLQEDEHFFHTGGDSLQLIALLAGLHERTGRLLSLQRVLSRPTLGRLIVLLTQTPPHPLSRWVCDPPCLSGSRRLLSDQEAAISFAERLSGRPVCQQAMLWSFWPGLSLANVEAVLQSLVRQEPALRMRRLLRKDSAGCVREWLDTEADGSVPWYRHKAAFSSFLHAPFTPGERLWRVRVALQSGQVCQLQFVFHHLIMDGQSGAWFGQECARRYAALQRGKPLTVAVATAVRPSVDSARLHRYWERRHRGWWAQEDHACVMAAPREGVGTERKEGLLSGRGTETWRRVRSAQWSEPGLLPALERFARQQGVPLFALLLFAFSLWQVVQTRRTHVLTGTMVSNRATPSSLSMLGCHTHLLALPQRFKPALTVLANLQQLAARWRRDLSHQALPCSALLQRPGQPRAILIFQGHTPAIPLKELRVSAQRRFPRWGEPETLLEISHHGECLCCLVHTPWRTDWRWQQRALMQGYLGLLGQVLLYPDEPLSSLLVPARA